MELKQIYRAPASRVGVLQFERKFLTTSIEGDYFAPGNNPVQGGEWDFGDED